jgi:hypothetical protein
MKISQRNSLCSYLYLKQAKMSCFRFIFSLFSSTKSENLRTEQVSSEGEASTMGEQTCWEKGVVHGIQC